MTVLSASGLEKEYGGEKILDSVSFSVNKGEKVGVIGSNGAGKTTLFSILSGRIEADGGRFFIEKNSSVGLLAQYSVDKNKTVYEEMLSGFEHLEKEEKELAELHAKIENGQSSLAGKYSAAEEHFREEGGYEYKNRCIGALRGLGLYEYKDLPTSALSGGQSTTLGLGKLLLCDHDILLLDEPTNHLDAGALIWLEDFIQKSGKTVLVISHDRYFLDKVAEKIILIEDGKARTYGGNYSQYKAKRDREDEITAHHYASEQKELARQRAYIEAQRRINRQRNIIAAESREKLLAKKEYTEKPKGEERAIIPKFVPAGAPSNDILKAFSLTMGYDKCGTLFKNLSFEVSSGERLFILGGNGCGKTTLLKILAGRLAPLSGYSLTGPSVSSTYLDQDVYSFSLGGETVIDCLWNECPHYTETQVRSLLAAFNFRGDDVFKQTDALSGGERARLSLARATLRPCDLLLLDEPTNHLDIRSREALETALEDYGGTLICVSHDRYFINKLATRIITFSDNGTVSDVKGGYAEYLDFTGRAVKSPRDEISESVSVPETADSGGISASKEKFLRDREEKNRIRNEKRKIENAKKEIGELEKRLSEISIEEERESTNYERLSELAAEKEKTELRLLELYEITM